MHGSYPSVSGYRKKGEEEEIKKKRNGVGLHGKDFSHLSLR